MVIKRTYPRRDGSKSMLEVSIWVNIFVKSSNDKRIPSLGDTLKKVHDHEPTPVQLSQMTKCRPYKTMIGKYWT